VQIFYIVYSRKLRVADALRAYMTETTTNKIIGSDFFLKIGFAEQTMDAVTRTYFRYTIFKEVEGRRRASRVYDRDDDE
jgi:hypothetical protein